MKQSYSQSFHDQIATLEQRCSNVNLLAELIVFSLTIDVPIEISRICLNVADQVIYILLPNAILNFSSQSFKFLHEFLTTRLFCFSMNFDSSANTVFILISEVIQATEEIVRLFFD